MSSKTMRTTRSAPSKHGEKQSTGPKERATRRTDVARMEDVLDLYDTAKKS